MNPRKIVLVPFVFLVAIIAAVPPRAHAQMNSPMSDEDMAGVVAAVLAEGSGKTAALTSGGVRFLSDRNVRDQWVVNPIAGYTARLLTVEEIRANFIGDFTYWEFGRFSKTPTGVKTTLTWNWIDDWGRKKFNTTTYWVNRVDGIWTVTEKEVFIEIYCGPREPLS